MNANDPSETAVNEQSLEQRFAALEQQRLDLESQRHQQMTDLNEQARLLSEAWQRLENQQRVIMHSRSETPELCAAPDTSLRTNPRPAVVDSRTVLLQASAMNVQRSNKPGPSAVEQFRLLQRDIQAHQTPNIDSNRTTGESS